MKIGQVGLQFLGLSAVMACFNMHGMFVRGGWVHPAAQVVHSQIAQQAAQQHADNEQPEVNKKRKKKKALSADKEQEILFLWTYCQKKARILALDEPGRPQLTREALDKLNAMHVARSW